MLRVGITGQSGFMGRHLLNYLKLKETIDLVNFKRCYFEKEINLNNFVQSCDVIVHIAAINRHENPQYIYDTNVGLVKKIIQACENTNSKPKIIFSSSTHEERDNLYGKSKLDGRKLLEFWAKKNNAKISSLIIPNVFGPFGKPFYNSFIATFCHQIINGQVPEIIKDNTVNLIYINELCEVFYEEIINDSLEIVNTKKVKHTSSNKVSEILNLLKEFKISYVEKGVIPCVPINSFELNLFNTFSSFISKDYYPREFIKHADERGSFVEVIRTGVSGQSSYSTTVPGITRGNHYHTRKIERFAVIKGKASIKFRKIDSEEVFEYFLDGDEPSYVDMPIWYTHNITNIGKEELITIFWINEPYNPNDPDTYFVKV